MKIACSLMWVRDAVNVNTTFNASNDKYKLEVCHISDKADEALKREFDIKVKKDDQKGKHFNAKSKYVFFFKDDAGNHIDPTTIGNGTKAIVNVTGSYEHKFMKQYGKGPVVASEVTVTELVPYEASPNGSRDEEEAL